MKILSPLLMILLISSCTTVSSITVSQIPPKEHRDQRVHAEGWSPIIIGIPFGSGYVDEARQDFVRKCTKGKIEGTVAKTFSKNYFLGFYGTQNVSFDGYCVEKVAAADVQKSSRSEQSSRSKKGSKKR